MFRFNPLVPLNLDELSQKELTPLLPRHKRAGGLQIPRTNFRSASAQRVDWEAPIAAAILISATAKVFTNTRLLPAEEKETCSAPCRGWESSFPRQRPPRRVLTLRADAAPCCGRAFQILFPTAHLFRVPHAVGQQVRLEAHGGRGRHFIWWLYDDTHRLSVHKQGASAEMNS